MASTIDTATLSVTVTESLTLGGYPQGSTNTWRFHDISNVSSRIITIPTTEVIIVTLHASAVAGGQFVEGDVRYVRITNKDDENHVGLIFRHEDSDEFGIKLDYGQTFIYNGDNLTGVIDTMDAAATSITANTFADLVDITAIADSAEVDIEVFVASK